MKVCVWFCCMGLDYKPPHGQLLFVEDNVLQGLGPSQSHAKVVGTTLADLEKDTGMYVDLNEEEWARIIHPTMTKVWYYIDQNEDGEGFSAIFVDHDALTSRLP